jgi:hypothetical protein
MSVELSLTIRAASHGAEGRQPEICHSRPTRPPVIVILHKPILRGLLTARPAKYLRNLTSDRKLWSSPISFLWALRRVRGKLFGAIVYA